MNLPDRKNSNPKLPYAPKFVIKYAMKNNTGVATRIINTGLKTNIKCNTGINSRSSP
jgi:hypothetical protein